jgi:hypothetical protein
VGIFKNPNSVKDTELYSMRVTQAILGTVIPIVGGQNRVASYLLWYGDFTATAQKQQGGKGLGGQTNVTYDYTAALAAALCQGPIASLTNIWDSNGRLGGSSVTENYTIPGGGGSYTVSEAAYFLGDFGVGALTSYSFMVDDYGSPGSTTIAGTFQVAFEKVSGSPSTGQYQLNVSTGTYTFSAADAGKTIAISYGFSTEWLETSEIYDVPNAIPYRITVQQSAYFHGNVQVAYYPSGTLLTNVGSSPAVGQYSFNSGGTYTFNSGDGGNAVEITYQYQDQSVLVLPSTSINVTIFAGTLGQSPWGFLTTNFPGQALGYSQLCYAASQAMQLGTSGELPNYNYELLALAPFGNGVTDCHPADFITLFLTDPGYGAGFPLANLGAWTGSIESVYNYWAANGFFISPVLNQQQTAASTIQQFCDAGQAGIFFSEGLLKIVPYGDTSAAGYGYQFSPPTYPVVSVNADNFIVKSASEEPITWTQKDPQDIYNAARIQYQPRLNSYNDDIVEEKDDASISQIGLRPESPQDYDFVCLLSAATFSANMRLKRNVYINQTFRFSLGWQYAYLEPMDIILVPAAMLTGDDTDTSTIAIRLTKVTDNPDGKYDFEAENFPWSVAGALLYPKQEPAGFQPLAGAADPGTTSVLIIEATNRLGLQAGNVLFILAGGESANWGGCDVWVSRDNATYNFYGRINQPGRVGTLTTTLTGTPSASVIDFSASPSPITGGTGATTISWNAPGFTNLTLYQGGMTSGDIIASGLGATGTQAATGVTDYTFFYLQDALSGIFIAQLQVHLFSGTNLANATFSASPNPMTLTGWNVPGSTTLSWSGGASSNMQIWVNQPSAATGGALLAAGGGTSGSTSAGGWVEDGTVFYLVDGTTGNIQAMITMGATFPILDSSFGVQLDNSNLELETVSAEDFENYATLSAIITSNALELIAYEEATLTLPGQYTLDYLYRGLWGTPVAMHNVGDLFARLDSAALQYQYDPVNIGDTVYFKFTAFNTLGKNVQDLSQVTAIAFTITGLGQGPIALATGIFQAGLGGVSTTYAGSLTYTATTMSITWIWNFVAYRTDLNLSQQTIQGQQVVTGLSSGTTYNFYPYLDDSQSPPFLSMVILGGVGSPPWAHVGTNVLWTQEQSAPQHYPMSAAPMPAATTSSGTGGGSGGGTYGSGGVGACPRGDMVVRSKERGVIPVRSLQEYELIDSPQGWVRAHGIAIREGHHWISALLSDGQEIVTTPGHCWPVLDEGTTVRADNLCLSHLLRAEYGAAFLQKLSSLKEKAVFVSFEIDSPEREYYIGATEPNIVSHNLKPSVA